VERDEAHLELWGRTDGVPLMIRVVHLLDLLIVSTDRQLQEGQPSTEAAGEGKYLFQREKSYQDGVVIAVNRHMSKKISLADIFGSGSSARRLASKRSEFLRYAQEAVEQQFQYLEDPHFKLHRHTPPRISEMTRSNISVESAAFGGHRFTVEESPSFKGILTMYHKYTMEVKCRGLPTDDFVSLHVANDKIDSAKSWKWMTWQESQDLLHQETRELLRLKGSASECLNEVGGKLGETTKSLDTLASTLARSDPAALEMVRDLQRQVEEAQRLVAMQAQCSYDSGRPSSHALPPNLISEKATESIQLQHSMKTGSSTSNSLLLQSRSAPALHLRKAAVAGGDHLGTAEEAADFDCVAAPAAPARRSRLFGALGRDRRKRH